MPLVEDSSWPVFARLSRTRLATGSKSGNFEQIVREVRRIQVSCRDNEGCPVAL